MRSLLLDLGVPPMTADELSSYLESCYAEPHRRYHTVEHITEVMAEVDRLLTARSGAADEASAVRLAVCFHDAVHDPRAAGRANEEASAKLATVRLLAAGVTPTIVSEVARLVRLTADHAVDPTDLVGSVLVDADLSILASDADRYDRYVSDVRAEYGHVDDEAWRAGRGAVLRRFLDADPLYRSGPDRARREREARVNLERELAALMAPGSAHGAGEPAGDAVPRPGAGEQVPGG